MKMQKRAAAAQATLDRFVGRPLRYGRDDCVRMLVFHLRKMGYKPQIAKAGSYSTPISARRALKRAGFDTIAEALDNLGLQRIVPAMAIVGDIIEGPSDDRSLGAFAVCVGNGRVIAWAPEVEGATVAEPVLVKAAWRA